MVCLGQYFLSTDRQKVQRIENRKLKIDFRFGLFSIVDFQEVNRQPSTFGSVAELDIKLTPFFGRFLP